MAANDLPPVPYREALLNRDGLLTPGWSAWFRQLFTRVGGNSGTDAATVATNLANHLADTSAAHAASAISNAPSGNLAATDVQAALNELQTDIDTISANDYVTNAKLANMANGTIKGRTTSGTGDPEDLTGAQATALLSSFTGDSGSGGVKGLVPAPASGDSAAGKFLKADGTWAAPTGSTSLIFAKYTSSSTAAQAAGAIIQFNTAVQDTNSAVTTGASWKFTAPSTGKYRITAELSFTLSASSHMALNLHKNGSATAFARIDKQFFPSASDHAIGGSVVVDLNAGDYFDLRNTNAIASLVGSATEERIWIVVESGTVTTSVTDVLCEYTTTTAQSVANGGSGTVIQYNTKVSDTHGTCVVSGVFTAPMDGTYIVTNNFRLTGATGGSLNVIGNTLNKNGSAYRGGSITGYGTYSAPGNGSTFRVKLLTGETCSVSAFQVDGAARNLNGSAADNWISIRREGAY